MAIGPEEVVPEVPVLVLWGMALGALVAYMVARGLSWVWTYSIGWVLVKLGEQLVINVWRVHWNPGAWLIEAANAVPRWLGEFAAGSDKAAARFFHSGARIQRWIVGEVEAITRDVYHFNAWLLRQRIPRLIAQFAKWGMPPYLVYRAIRLAHDADWHRIARALRHQGAAVSHAIVQRIEQPFRADWEWLHRARRALDHLIHVTAGAAAARVAPWIHVFPRLHWLERWTGFTAKRLRRLEALLGVTGFATVLAMALGVPDWRCITRGNIGRASRAVCGSHGGLLDDFLGLLADFFILENVCTLLPLFETVASDVAKPLVADLTAIGAGICYGEAPAAALRVPPRYLPPVGRLVPSSLPG